MAIYPWDFLSRSSWFSINKGLLYSPLVLSLLILLFINGFLKFKHRSHRNPPPSPPKLPIIGNLHQLGRLPHRSLRSLSDKYGPLMLLKLGQIPALVISSAKIVEEMVKNHDVVFSDRPSMTAAKIMLYGRSDFFLAPYGEYWRTARKICVLELLSQKRVQSFRFVREEEVASLINRIRHECCNGRSVNLSQMLLETSHTISSRCIIGKKAKDDGNFGVFAKRFVRTFSDFSFGDLFPGLGWLDVLTGLIGRFKTTFNEMDAFLDSVIQEQIKSSESNILDEDHSKKDLVQILLHLLQNDQDTKLTMNNVKAILLDMFLAGTESTATTTEWAMAELLKNPRVLKRVQEEVRRVVNVKGKVEEDDINKMEYLKCIIKETLRIHPAAPLLVPRETSARIKLNGYDILPKTRVLINAWMIQRDPQVWENPEEFIPERFENNTIDFRGSNFEFIPFGVGRRGCPGISFGVSVLEFFIANLLYWFDWKLADDADCVSLDMTETFFIAASKKLPLHLVPSAYCS
ncbi:Cytochrome P450 71A1 [Hibiscus syriacus]|uniref:Cytochrome P450 71A1 n=1 Tax=Hibiscus syriacus TaxID=106335 RepID=A0A6A2ZQ76_HIBSY|nr:cytochrome P450 71A1-like [Hibiscus syriacus]KAE8693963.1 Cytochrome P450 71A1 [Hibiscus syriacus]